MAFSLSFRSILFSGLCLLASSILPQNLLFSEEARVLIAEVEQKSVASGRSFVGTVMPLKASIVGSAIEGRIEEYELNEGDRVKAGDVLAKLDTTALSIELEIQKAELMVAEEALKELENGAREEEKAQLEARLQSALARMDFQESRMKRTETLFKSRTMSEEEMLDVQLSFQEAKNAHAEAQAAYDLLLSGARPEQIAKATAQVKVQKEIIRRIENQIAEHTIKAPFDGYVVSRLTELGQWVTQGDPIIEVAQLKKVDIHVHVLEDYIGTVHPGQSVTVQLGAFPGKVYVGEVAVIIPQADLRSRSFPVKVRLENPFTSGNEVMFKAGMFAQVELPVGQQAEALFVPKDALVLESGQTTVFVVNQETDGPATTREIPVRLGVSDQGTIQIFGNLKVGDRVVVRGNERLESGQQVSWKNFATNTSQ
ncbi:Efflux RND transporter periplasmic adaptor subunit [Planctomycetales bacterium 10988]|nr:Efflux RND transporter periplasmic adaptor subunit [Planctomycetales bacterium 10988]